ncbi:MAG: 16S rRNA (cytosine(1402)-N(4))-methyltransferase RsmH [Patescibacteria group bacterium]|nr:16S rRNA (cytosine(1402)-N(4))-methyltransferase RsmH [Patescibacteria group bacterium]MDE2172889.1 16S rRNA (cytosine(1402)-N(4))-methyltransferase RsmH [Patescibacteria group bacterium]
MGSVHVPVLLHEIVEHLLNGSGRSLRAADRESDSGQMPWFLDGTLGGAGHTKAMIDATSGRINVIGLDRDAAAIERAGRELSGIFDRQADGGPAPKLILENENFRNLDTVLSRHGVPGVDMILFDLGMSSDELEHSGKGFSFLADEPLLMTLGDPATYQFTARDIVNDWAEDVIANIIYGYGQERYARRITRAIVRYRLKKKIETSGELSEIIRSAVPGFYRRLKIHPATKTFQALRIAVNDELQALREGLAKGYGTLNAGGRMAVISFHSLEDRIVKDFYKEHADTDTILTGKPITASASEVAANPRSRSAKLRIIEKNNHHIE